MVSPHNEAIRYEFEQGFARWHRRRHGMSVRIDWRSIGGTTEIIRHLNSEYAAAAQAWWRQRGEGWPAGAREAVLATRPPPASRSDLVRLYQAFRQVDDLRQVGVGIDLLFGGGEYDHTVAHRSGLTVPVWPPGEAPAHLFASGDTELIPERLSGETCRTATLFGNAMSMFGIVYNIDRVGALGVARPPGRWDDLADPVYFRALGVADPTKSGSIAKAFEMLVPQKMHDAAAAAGFDDAVMAAPP